MSDPLVTYLHDHLAGAKFAIELVEHLGSSSDNSSLREFSAHIGKEIAADRDTLQRLCGQMGDQGSRLKEAGSWLAERAAQLKLRLGNGTGTGEFEALEMLSLGICGKLKLWTALSMLAVFDERLKGLDYPHLIQRATTQHADVETCRLEAAKTALRKSNE